MSTATATKPSKAKVDVADLLRTIMAELKGVFFERDDIIEAFILCLLAKEHGFVIGPPGAAKSNLVSELCQRIINARYFKTQFHSQFTEENLYGAIDIAQYDHTSKTGKGIWERDTDGTLATAHIADCDEVDKAGKSINLMLGAMNEREYKNGKTMLDLPLISMFGSANEFLAPDLGPAFDRFLVRIDCDYIVEPSNFVAFLDMVKNRKVARHRTVVDLTDLLHAIEVEVPAVDVPIGVLNDIAKLRITLLDEGVRPSDRRWGQCVGLLKASAYLNGRSVVDNDDLIVLENVLWIDPVDVPKVKQHVRAATSELAVEANRIAEELREVSAQVKALTGQSVADRSDKGVEAKIKVDEMDATLRDLIEKANRQGRNTSRYESVRGDIRAVLVSIYTICLGLSPEAAASKVSK